MGKKIQPELLHQGKFALFPVAGIQGVELVPLALAKLCLSLVKGSVELFVLHGFEKIVTAGKFHGVGYVLEPGIGGEKDAYSIQVAAADGI